MKLNESEETEEASLIQKYSQNQMFFDTAGISPREPDYWLSGCRRKGYKSMAQALVRNRRILNCNDKRKNPSDGLTRMKVAMGSLDAEEFVVVMKPL